MESSSQSVGSFEDKRSERRIGSLVRRGLALVLAYLMIPLGIGDVYAMGYGQASPPPPPDQAYGQQYGPATGQVVYNRALSPDELDQLVAPVALYPDALLAQVLAASTYPAQVVEANRWIRSYEGAPPERIAQMANATSWDPSVKSLTAFPSVLENLARNLDWATQLGNAYYNQPQDVMEAVQAMRQQAYEAGNLRSTAQQRVVYSPTYISIDPVDPAVVYVPYYNPWIVYGALVSPWYPYYLLPPPAYIYYGGLAIGFGAGISIVAFSRWAWGWGHWRPDWRRRAIYYRQNRYISRSRSMRNRGRFGRFDRHYVRRDFRRPGRRIDRNRQLRDRRTRELRRQPNVRRTPRVRQPSRERQNRRTVPRIRTRNQPNRRTVPRVRTRPQPNRRNVPRVQNRSQQNRTRAPQQRRTVQRSRPQPNRNQSRPRVTQQQQKQNVRRGRQNVKRQQQKQPRQKAERKQKTRDHGHSLRAIV